MTDIGKEDGTNDVAKNMAKNIGDSITKNATKRILKEKVRDVMTPNAISIDIGDTLENAGRLMQAEQVSMLVVKKNGETVGLLTAGDWFKSFFLHVGCHLPQTKFRTDRAGQFDLQKEKMEVVQRRAVDFKQTKVHSVMNTRFHTINENATLIEAAHEMKSTELRRLLVVNHEGKLVGVLGRTKAILALLDELT